MWIQDKIWENRLARIIWACELSFRVCARAYIEFMIVVMKQLVNIKFQCKLGKTPTENYEMLKTVCGDNTLSQTSFFYEYCFIVQFFKRRSRKMQIRSRKRNCSRTSYRMMTDEPNVKKELYKQNLRGDLAKRCKVDAALSYVPYSELTPLETRRYWD